MLWTGMIVHLRYSKVYCKLLT